MSWLPRTVSPDDLKLPPRPRLKHRRYIDMCNFCHSVHLDVSDAIKCREAALGRSQD